MSEHAGPLKFSKKDFGVKQGTSFITTQVFCHAVGQCDCGSTTPIVLVLHPGSPSMTGCEVCGAIFTLGSFSYDIEDPDNATIKVGVAGPQIHRPS